MLSAIHVAIILPFVITKRFVATSRGSDPPLVFIALQMSLIINIPITRYATNIAMELWLIRYSFHLIICMYCSCFTSLSYLLRSMPSPIDVLHKGVFIRTCNLAQFAVEFLLIRRWWRWRYWHPNDVKLLLLIQWRWWRRRWWWRRRRWCLKVAIQVVIVDVATIVGKPRNVASTVGRVGRHVQMRLCNLHLSR